MPVRCLTLLLPSIVHWLKVHRLADLPARCIFCSLSSPNSPFFSVQDLRWNSVQAESALYVVPAAQSAPDPGPMGRKHVPRTICNGKTNPVKKDFVDFAEWGNGVQLPCVLVTDAFSSAYLANLHIHLNLSVASDNINLDTPSPFHRVNAPFVAFLLQVSRIKGRRIKEKSCMHSYCSHERISVSWPEAFALTSCTFTGLALICLVQ